MDGLPIGSGGDERERGRTEGAGLVDLLDVKPAERVDGSWVDADGASAALGLGALGDLSAPDHDARLRDGHGRRVVVHVCPAKPSQLASTKPVKQREPIQGRVGFVGRVAIRQEAGDLFAIPRSKFGTFPARERDPFAWVTRDDLMLHRVGERP